MRLVYEATGVEVKVGDIVKIHDRDRTTKYRVDYFRQPHKSSSSGHITVVDLRTNTSHEYYVAVIGAVWIEREDRPWENEVNK